ncbi:hypothetical protein QTP86_007989 [Hemibagrus guttatus]|nr:hypothetical protein QTP86_007989 [Hemibagrus guttatus]
MSTFKIYSIINKGTSYNSFNSSGRLSTRFRSVFMGIFDRSSRSAFVSIAMKSEKLNEETDVSFLYSESVHFIFSQESLCLSASLFISGEAPEPLLYCAFITTVVLKMVMAPFILCPGGYDEWQALKGGVAYKPAPHKKMYNPISPNKVGVNVILEVKHLAISPKLLGWPEFNCPHNQRLLMFRLEVQHGTEPEEEAQRGTEPEEEAQRGTEPEEEAQRGTEPEATSDDEIIISHNTCSRSGRETLCDTEECGQCQILLENEINIFKKLVSRRKHEVLQNFLVNRGCYGTAARSAELDWQEEEARLPVSTDPFPILLFHKTYPENLAEVSNGSGADTRTSQAQL